MGKQIVRRPVNAQTMAMGQTLPLPQPQQLEPPPFGLEYQGMLLKVLLGDGFFARNLGDYLQPHFFQNEAMAWAWGFARNHNERYGSFPTLMLLLDQAKRLSPQFAPVYTAVLERVRDTPVQDENWLRDQALEFVRKCVFMEAFIEARDLFNAGGRDAVYDLMQERLDRIRAVTWEIVDRGWLAEGFADRHIYRQDQALLGVAVGTGIANLDKILEGGAYPGFVGTWLAYPKVGKTTLLVNLGSVSIRAYYKRTLHVVLEGSRQMVEGRYDTIFMDEFYSNVKKGDVDSAKYAAAFAEMQHLRGLGVVRGFTENWDTNIIHIDDEIKELKRVYGWEPEVIVLDYADLLRGRPGRTYANETQEQVQAFKDIKALANRGFRIWTASQAQRPKDEDWDHKQHILTSKSIADAYGKVRVADFIGSINQTVTEREQGIMRLYAELYRDNAAQQLITVGSDFQKMRLGSAPKIDGVSAPNQVNTQGAVVQKQLGYTQLQGVV